MTPFLALLVVAQTGESRPVHPKTSVRVTDERPVTAAEARNAFVRAENLLQKAHALALGTPRVPAAQRVVTRDEIVAEMARVVKIAEAGFRFTPTPLTFDTTKLKVSPAQRPALQRLIAMGCVAPIGPLAVGPSQGLSPKQFGDALGFFMARVSQLSQLPDPRWTPMLQKG